MEEIIKKLLDNKVLSGTSLGAIGSLVAIVIILFNGVLGIPLYVMIGVFVVFTIIVTVKSIQTSKVKNNEVIGNKDLQVVIDKVKESGISTQTILSYIDSLKERDSLLNHKLFTSEYRRFIYAIEQLEKKTENRGQCWVISKFYRILLDTIINHIKSYIEANITLIEDETTKLNIDGIITTIYDSINGKETNKKGYETIAMENGIDKPFIEEYNKVHQYVIDSLDKQLNIIKNSSFTNDYNRYIAVLNAVLMALEETFSDGHIEKVFAINGRFTELYKEMTYLLERRFLK